MHRVGSRHRVQDTGGFGKGVQRVRCQSSRESTSITQIALEKMVSSINRLLFDYEEKQARIRAKRFAAGSTSIAPPLEAPQPGKTHSFRASVSGEKLVEQAPTSSSESATAVADVAASNRSLKAYLALPVEQYSLLDPKWITRDDQRPGVFLLRVPLLDLVGVDLTPQLRIAVDIDANAGKVEFAADGFKLGEPRFDRSDFKLEMKSRLSQRPVSDAPMSRLMSLWRKAPSATAAVVTSAQPTVQRQDAIAVPPASTSTSSSDGAATRLAAAATTGAAGSVSPSGPVTWSEDAGVVTPTVIVSTGSSSSSSGSSGFSSTGENSRPVEASHTDVIDDSHIQALASVPPAAAVSAPTSFSQQPSAAATATTATAVALGGPPAKLCCSVSVSLTFTVPHPLSIVPGPLLTATGSLIARIAMQRMLPSFLDLLAVDYGRWVAGGGGGATRDASAGSLVAAPPATSATSD